MNNNYNKKLKTLARVLRTESKSKAEQVLWKLVLSKGQSGTKFKRQRPIGNYIIDFFSSELKLVIEIDGNSHVSKSESDFEREEYLISNGFHILRFSERDVVLNLREVQNQIQNIITNLKNDEILPLASFV